MLNITIFNISWIVWGSDEDIKEYQMQIFPATRRQFFFLKKKKFSWYIEDIFFILIFHLIKEAFLNRDGSICNRFRNCWLNYIPCSSLWRDSIASNFWYGRSNWCDEHSRKLGNNRCFTWFLFLIVTHCLWNLVSHIAFTG